MFNNPNPYSYMPQGPAFQRPAYQPSMQMYPQQVQQMQQPMMPESGLQARFVSGEEEARASNVMPGMPCFFVDRANGMAFYKAIDPNTGAVDFRRMKEIPPEVSQVPQYATMEALSALKAEFDQILDQRFAALSAPKTSQRKAVTSNDE